MMRTDPADRPGATEALQAALLTRGLDADDFVVEEQIGSHDLASAFGVVGDFLRVRCCSTGEERLYSTGSGSAWFGAFLMDLGVGHFADAERRHGSGYLPMARPARGLLIG